MTALCGGGTSGPNSGVSPAIILTTTAIEAFLTGLSLDPVAATVISGVVAASLTIDANTYCATDPPSDPGLTASDLVAVLDVGDPAVSVPAAAKVLQWFQSRYWFTICSCTTGPQPTPPTVSNPGPVSQNPGLPTSTAPCWNITVPFTVAAQVSGTVGSATVLTSQATPPSAQTTSINNGSAVSPSSWLGNAVVPGVTNMRIGLSLDQLPSSGKTLQAYFLVYDSTGTHTLGGAEIIYGSSGIFNSSSFVLNTLPSNSTWWEIGVVNNSVSAITGTLTFSFLCPSGTSVAQPCCPPDPNMIQLLRQILALNQLIYEDLPVRIPSYAGSTAHTGLSGNGTQSIGSSTVGVKVDVTTLPPAYGLVVGSPNTYLDLGWITPVTNEGPEAGTRITRTSQVFPLPDATNAVDYALPAGAVITVTELLAG